MAGRLRKNGIRCPDSMSPVWRIKEGWEKKQGASGREAPEFSHGRYRFHRFVVEVWWEG